MRRDIQNIDDDIIRKKRVIGEMIYSDPDIIEVLDNDDIDPECPEDALYVNIYPFIRVPGTQDTSMNYITFMLDDVDTVRGNAVMKSQYLRIVIFVHKDLVKTEYGAERHDLLAYLVKDIFHLSNKLGVQLKLVGSKEGYTDNDYCTRTLQFEMTTPNSMQPYNTNKYERESIVHNHDRSVRRDPV